MKRHYADIQKRLPWKKIRIFSPPLLFTSLRWTTHRGSCRGARFVFEAQTGRHCSFVFTGRRLVNDANAKVVAVDYWRQLLGRSRRGRLGSFLRLVGRYQFYCVKYMFSERRRRQCLQDAPHTPSGRLRSQQARTADSASWCSWGKSLDGRGRAAKL